MSAFSAGSATIDFTATDAGLQQEAAKVEASMIASAERMEQAAAAKAQRQKEAEISITRQRALERAAIEDEIRQTSLRLEGRAMDARIDQIKSTYQRQIEHALATDNAILASRLRTLRDMKIAEEQAAAAPPPGAGRRGFFDPSAFGMESAQLGRFAGILRGGGAAIGIEIVGRSISRMADGATAELQAVADGIKSIGQAAEDTARKVPVIGTAFGAGLDMANAMATAADFVEDRWGNAGRTIVTATLGPLGRVYAELGRIRRETAEIEQQTKKWGDQAARLRDINRDIDAQVGAIEISLLDGPERAMAEVNARFDEAIEKAKELRREAARMGPGQAADAIKRQADRLEDAARRQRDAGRRAAQNDALDEAEAKRLTELELEQKMLEQQSIEKERQLRLTGDIAGAEAEAINRRAAQESFAARRSEGLAGFVDPSPLVQQQLENIENARTDALAGMAEQRGQELADIEAQNRRMRLQLAGNDMAAELAQNEAHYAKLIEQAKGNAAQIAALKDQQGLAEDQIRKKFADREKQELQRRNATLREVNADIRQTEMRMRGDDLAARLDQIKEARDAEIEAAREANDEELAMRLEALKELELAEARRSGAPRAEVLDLSAVFNRIQTAAASSPPDARVEKATEETTKNADEKLAQINTKLDTLNTTIANLNLGFAA